MNKIVLLDNGHGSNTAGKCSPDKTFREYAYARMIVKRLAEELIHRDLDADVKILVPEEWDVSLKERVRRANEICTRYGARNVALVSVHVDAAGADGKWHDAGGWSAYTTRGVTRADKLADCLYDAAEFRLRGYSEYMEASRRSGAYGAKQRPIRTDRSDGDRDKEADFYILANTRCPAVLTENLFQDNRYDVAWLNSIEGKRAIVMLHADGIERYIKGDRKVPEEEEE